MRIPDSVKKRNVNDRTPRLTLHTNRTPVRIGLLPENERRSARDTISGCTAESNNDTSDLEFIRELRADSDSFYREYWLGKAAEYDAAAAKTTRGRFRALARENAAICRANLTEMQFPQLPVSAEYEGETAYVPYGIWSSTYSDTVTWTIYDPVGRGVVKASVTGSDEGQAAALKLLTAIGIALARTERRGLTLVAPPAEVPSAPVRSQERDHDPQTMLALVK